jgi:hypothetical protein
MLLDYGVGIWMNGMKIWNWVCTSLKVLLSGVFTDAEFRLIWGRLE